MTWGKPGLEHQGGLYARFILRIFENKNLLFGDRNMGVKV